MDQQQRIDTEGFNYMLFPSIKSQSSNYIPIIEPQQPILSPSNFPKYVCVFPILFDGKNYDVLLYASAMKKKPMAISGQIRENEQHTQAASRELVRYTGLQIKMKNFIEFYKYTNYFTGIIYYSYYVLLDPNMNIIGPARSASGRVDLNSNFGNNPDAKIISNTGHAYFPLNCLGYSFKDNAPVYYPLRALDRLLKHPEMREEVE